MKNLELKKKNEKELNVQLQKLKKDLFNLNSSTLAGEDSLKKKGRIKATKREIARIKTILNNKTE